MGRFQPVTKDDLLKLVEKSDRMKVEADSDAGICAKTVDELRRCDWSRLVVGIPREPDRPESVVKISLER